MNVVNLSMNIDTTKPEEGEGAEYAIVAEIVELGLPVGQRRREAQSVWSARINAPVADEDWEVLIYEYTPGTAHWRNTFPTWERAAESALSLAFAALAVLAGLAVKDAAGAVGA